MLYANGPMYPLQAGAQSLRHSHRQAHGRDVEEWLTVGPAEVDVHHLPVCDGGARLGKIVRYLQRAGEVVGGAQRKNAEHNVGAGNATGGVGHCPVAAADNHQVVPVRNHPVKRRGQLAPGQHMVHGGDRHACLAHRVHRKFVCRSSA